MNLFDPYGKEIPETPKPLTAETLWAKAKRKWHATLKWTEHFKLLATLITLALAIGGIFAAKKAIELVRERDLIPGTQTTHAHLKRIFPFGYIIFSEQDGTWKYDARKSDRLTFYINPEQVKIDRDFSLNSVRVNIGHLRASKDGQIMMFDETISRYFRIRIGPVYRFKKYYIPNEPEIMFATLNDDQHSPVFVIGLAILPGPP